MLSHPSAAVEHFCVALATPRGTARITGAVSVLSALIRRSTAQPETCSPAARRATDDPW